MEDSLGRVVMKVILAEPDDTWRLWISEFLSRKGYEVQSCVRPSHSILQADALIIEPDSFTNWLDDIIFHHRAGVAVLVISGCKQYIQFSQQLGIPVLQRHQIILFESLLWLKSVLLNKGAKTQEE
jgi:hypothetical protein